MEDDEFMKSMAVLLKWMFISAIGLSVVGCGDSSKAKDNRQIGEASTKFNLLTPNDKIKIESFSDPQVSGITCYVSYAKKGGGKSLINMEEDRSNSSLDCVKTGLIEFDEQMVASKSSYEVFRRNASFAFKTTQVVRYYDSLNKSFIYMIYSDKIIDGSPENSIAAISCGETKPSIAGASDAGVVNSAINNQITGDCKIKNPIK